MKEREAWENTLRAKLKGFEAETLPGDWDAIAGRLPEEAKTVIRSFGWRYAAASLLLLLSLSGGYWLFRRTDRRTPVAGWPEQTTPVRTNPPVEAAPPVEKAAVQPSTVRRALAATPKRALERRAVSAPPSRTEVALSPPSTVFGQRSRKEGEERLWTARANPVSAKGNARKRWSFGLGGGGYTVGTGGGESGPLFAATSPAPVTVESVTMKTEDVRKRDVVHRPPLSFGVGVGYALNNRWSLQSGVNYTLRTSEWATISKYLEESVQRLHFIGLPLSVSYRIAEWNRFRFYASTGVLIEWNAGGRIRTDSYHDFRKVQTQTRSVRMKEGLVSVNARVGVSYPLLRYVNAFAETGVDYYFDNGSRIETFRSDHPFHLSLQAGVRFGF